MRREFPRTPTWDPFFSRRKRKTREHEWQDDERDGGRDERTKASRQTLRGREGIGVFALREKDENFTRDYGCISRDFDERGSVSRRETRRRGERALERRFDFDPVEKEKVRVSGANGDANAAEMMTCSATMLRDTCKVIAFCGKDDNTVEITRMVVKILLALAAANVVQSGAFQGEEGEEALEILTLRLAHSSVACDGDVEKSGKDGVGATHK